MKTFISHSTKDKPLVLQIAERLRKENVWVDTWDMEVGDLLAEEIEKGIDTAKNFLVILSINWQHKLFSTVSQVELPFILNN